MCSEQGTSHDIRYAYGANQYIINDFENGTQIERANSNQPIVLF